MGKTFVDIISSVGIIEPTVAIETGIVSSSSLVDIDTKLELKPVEYKIYCYAELKLYSSLVDSIMKILGTASTATLAFVELDGNEYRVTAPVGALNNAIDAFIRQAIDLAQALRIAIARHNRSFAEYAIQTNLTDKDVMNNAEEDTGYFVARHVSEKVYNNFGSVTTSVSGFAETEVIRMIYAEYSRAIGNGAMSEPGAMDMYDTVRDVVAGYVRYLVDLAAGAISPKGGQIQIKAMWLKRLPTPTFDEVFGGKDVT